MTENNHATSPAVSHVWPIKILDRITTISCYLSGAALFMIVFAYIFEVVMRYFFNSPTSWVNDSIGWMLSAMIMLAMPEVTRVNGHIVISFFIEKLPLAGQLQWGRFVSLVGFVMCWVVTWICWQETGRQYTQQIMTLWNHPIPKWWISGLIPFGFGLSGLQMLRLSIKPIQNR